MPPAVAVDLVLRALEHVGREIDSRHLAVGGICVEREAGADAELEHPRARLDGERPDDHRDARIEHAPEQQIVEMGELVVQSALVRLRVRYGHTPPLV